MNLNMSFRHMDSSEAIKRYTTEKSDKLKKFFNGQINVTWNFSVERLEHVAHCHLVGNSMDYFGEAATVDMHSSIDQAVEKIEKQIRKHKEITKDHLHKNSNRTPLV
ncbi:ribosome-associated translation inhibitor RaiA [Bdellovibrionota bacterium FG-2]